jgi:hypothetical protein
MSTWMRFLVTNRRLGGSGLQIGSDLDLHVSCFLGLYKDSSRPSLKIHSYPQEIHPQILLVVH